jgi:hypothetical protein
MPKNMDGSPSASDPKSELDISDFTGIKSLGRLGYRIPELSLIDESGRNMHPTLSRVLTIPALLKGSDYIHSAKYGLKFGLTSDETHPDRFPLASESPGAFLQACLLDGSEQSCKGSWSSCTRSRDCRRPVDQMQTQGL